MAVTVFVSCGLISGAGAGASAAPEKEGGGPAGGLALPQPTGRHDVGVRSTFLLDPARTEPTTGTPRAIPVRVWYPASDDDGPPATYFSAAVQPVIEQGIGAPAGFFDVDTHATVDPPARRHVRGVLLFTGGFGVPVALYTALISDLASRGYAVVAFDHPHETFVAEQPGGSVIPNDLVDDGVAGAAFQDRLRDIGAVLDALEELVPQARSHTPIGIFGHSNGGAAAGLAIPRHPEIRAGVNLDGFTPAELIMTGLDRPFGLMVGRDVTPEELRDIELFLANMRAPHRELTLDVRHYGFSDFVVFIAQTQRADPALGTALEATYSTGTADSLRAGRRALSAQRRFLAQFFDRYLETERDSDEDDAARSG
jgi:predicted dienelactone hydrolase